MQLSCLVDLYHHKLQESEIEIYQLFPIQLIHVLNLTIARDQCQYLKRWINLHL